MNENDLKAAKFITGTIVCGIVCLLLGLSAIWQWAAVTILTEQMRSGYVEEPYARELSTRWVKPAKNK